MSDPNYTKGELNLKFDLVHERFSTQDKSLNLILEQTTKHNGRLSKVERVLLIVGCVTVTILILNGSELVNFIRTLI